MSVRISDLLADERTVPMEVGAETVRVTYRPSAYTPQLEEDLRALNESKRTGAGLAHLLATTLVGWEVVDDTGAPYPTTEAALMALPTRFLWQVLAAINADLSVPEGDPKDSGGTSLVGAKSGRRRNGTG
jgi:hypothetical protein